MKQEQFSVSYRVKDIHGNILAEVNELTNEKSLADAHRQGYYAALKLAGACQITSWLCIVNIG